MAKGTKGKGKTIFWSIVGFIVVVALAFIITSLIMASVHNNTLITEWQSWFGIAQTAPEAVENAVEGVQAALSVCHKG